MSTYTKMSVKAMLQLPGIVGLPTLAAGKFVQALRSEEKGDHAKAEQLLNEAIADESKRKEIATA